MNFDAVRQYWNDRAAGDSSAQSTTQDFYLREIEANVLTEWTKTYRPGSVADVGCGDGRTTARLAARYPEVVFSGFDYSSSMIENARRIHDSGDMANVKFEVRDICEGLDGSFDLIYTTRCLINLPSWELQRAAIRNIYDALTVAGVYLMVENFAEGQANFNQVRKQFNLPEIPIREHNCFFDRHRLLEYVDSLFVLEAECNISSAYYLVSRVIYSKICAEAGISPNYFDDHHRLAASLPFCGEFGPVRLMCLKKRHEGPYEP